MNIQNIIYVTSVLPENRENQIIKLKANKASIAAFKYHRLLCEGLSQNGMNVNVLTYNKLNREISILDGMQERIGSVNYNYIVPKGTGVIAYLDLLLKTYKKVQQTITEDTVIVCDVLNATISYAALLAAKRSNIESVSIVTDFPSDSKKSINGRLSWRVINNCSKWILLTNQMYDYLGKKKKAVILEGHVDRGMTNKENSLSEKVSPRKCIYAGSLKRKYGITKLIQAFEQANVKDVELHIYGAGEVADDLKRMKQPHIFYHGVVPNAVVVEDEIHASLLINPRPTNGEYTKYSFPSKNLEYMASGTPLLTTKLAGMPTEYYDYIYLFDDETVEGMAKTLRSVLSKPDVELHEKGISAKNFVIENKSNIAQAKKVIDLIND